MSVVYCIGLFCAVCYILDSAILVKSILVNGNCIASKVYCATCAVNSCHAIQRGIQRQAVLVNYQVLLALFQLNVNLLVSYRNTIACAQCCIRNLVLHILYVGYRFILACINVSYICIVSCYAGQILQFFVQRYLYIGTIVGYLDVLITRSVFCTAEVNLCTRCYIGCCTAVSRNVPACICYVAYFLQLAKVYCIGEFRTFCYVLDSAILVKSILVNCNCIASKVYCATFAGDGLNASQLFFQRNANYITIIAYLNVSIAIKFNFITRFYIRCIALFSFQLPTLACASSSFTYLLQLCYVYCVSIFSTCCYIGNLTSNFFTLYRTAYRNSTISCLPSNTGFSFSSTIAKRVGSCACYTAGTQSNSAFTGNGNFGIMTENNSVINSCFG